MGKDLKGKELGKGLTQRADGTYMARFVDRYGKRNAFYDKDIKKLRRRLERARYEAEQGVLYAGGDTMLNDWFEEFLIIYKKGKVKETTLHRMGQTYSACRKRAIGMMRLRDIRAIHIQLLINEMAELGLSYGTIKLVRSLLNDMFKKAIGNGYMLVNPCDAVVMPPKEACKARYLTEKEQEMFMEVAKEYFHYDIFCLSLSCGARIGEVLGLKWSDIDMERKTIHIQRTLHYSKVTESEPCHFFFTSTKTTSSNRVIPLLPETEKILRRIRSKQLRNKMLHTKTWKEELPFDDMVFTTAMGRPIRYGDVNRTIKSVITKANLQEEEVAKFESRTPFVLESFAPHCFRHTFVTRCKKKGVPYESIQLYVGHSDKEMTEYYDHNVPEIDAKALADVNMLGGI